MHPTRDALVRLLASVLALTGGAAIVLALTLFVQYARTTPGEDPFIGLALALGLAALAFGVPTLLMALPVVARPQRSGLALATGLWVVLALGLLAGTTLVVLAPIGVALGLALLAAVALTSRTAEYPDTTT